MKKVLLVLSFLAVILVSGCSLKQSQSTKMTQQQQSKLIKHNQKIWNEKIRAAQNIDNPNYDQYVTVIPQGYNDEDMSLKRFKSGNQLAVKARVLNLQPEVDRLLNTQTKATILIEKVLTGNKELQGKTIKTEFTGGLTTAGNYFISVEGNYEGDQVGFPNKKTSIYTTTATKPMPKIGQRIILGLKRYQPENKYRQAMLKKNGLTTKNFYVIQNPEATMWVKENGKYRVNNPAFYLKENKTKVKNMMKLTAKLNKENS